MFSVSAKGGCFSLQGTIMLNNTVSTKVLGIAFFGVLLAVLSLTACGGGGGGSVTLVPGLAVSAVTSHASGVAPLAVFFDATGTTDLHLTSYPTQPFHDLQYTWNFGDSAGSPAPSGTVTTWLAGSQTGTASCTPTPLPGCRNYATGAITAHVYENTGTFYPSLTIYDGTNTTTYNLPAITVTAFSGTTYCYYSSSAYGSCPSGGTEYTTSGDFVTDIGNAITAGARQILFKRGDTFTSTTGATISKAGPGIIGSYGSSGSAVPVLSTSGTGYGVILNMNSGSDWRVMDLNLTDSTSANTEKGVYGLSHVTVLRTTFSNLLYATEANGGIGVNNYFVVQDSTIGTSSQGGGASYGIYTTGNYVATLGTYININQIGTSHDIRYQGGNDLIISNNNLIGGSGYEGFLVHGAAQYGEISDKQTQLSGYFY